jgi:hypothetical protein
MNATNDDAAATSQSEPRKPTCYTCGELAEIVCLMDPWVMAGCPIPAPPDKPAGIFCCREHTEPTQAYWFWIVKPELRDDIQPSIQEFRYLLHVARKKWGMPFLAWLFTQNELYHLT